MLIKAIAESGYFFRAVLIFSAVAAVNPAAVQAQMKLEEVIVTAQRREQSLQNVPISIEAYSGDTILKQGFRTMEDLVYFSPSVQMDVQPRDQDVTVRGAGSVGNNLALQQSAPTFIDGIYYGRSGQSMGRFLDIERVEILTGPQPVYFGQDALVGAFNITTRKPTPEWEGFVVGEMGNFSTKQIEAGVGGPITDTLGIRVAGKYHQTDGHLINVVTRSAFPRTESYSGRVTFEWTPSEDFDATLQANYGYQENGGQSVVLADAVGNPDLRNSDGQFYYITGFAGINVEPLHQGLNRWGISVGPSYLIPGPEVRAVSNGRAQFDLSPLANLSPVHSDGKVTWLGQDISKPLGASLNMNYHLANGIELSSITGISLYERYQVWQPGAVPFMHSPFYRGEDLTQLSQEFRAVSQPGGIDLGQINLEWMFGLYWQNQDLNLVSENWRAQSRRQIRAPIGTDDATWKAVFGTVTLNLTERVAIDLGARYSAVDKYGRNVMYIASWIFDDGTPAGRILPHNNAATMPAGFANLRVKGHTDLRRGCGVGVATAACPPNALNEGNHRHREIDPQVTLRYQINDDVSTYAKWVQGFKGGSFNVEFGDVVTVNAFVLEPEQAESWELGMKGTFWESRLRTNLTLFWSDYTNLQVATAGDQVIDPSSVIASRTINVGGQRVRGAELSGDVLITENLRFGLGASFMDGEYTNYPNAGCTLAEIVGRTCDDPVRAITDRTGQKAARTPDWVVTSNADYWMPVLDNYRASFNVNFKLSDGYITDAESFSKTIRMDTHTKLNASIGFGNLDDTWRWSIWGRNLTDSRVEYFPEFDLAPVGLVTSDLSQGNYRSYGLQFNYNY